MKLLLETMLMDQFVVDESPMTVYLSQEEDTEDLLGLVGRIMMENERLQDLNDQLQTRSARPEELEKFMKTLLPTLDSFDRVLHLARGYQKSEEIDNWLKSVESIYYRLLNMLETYGLYQLSTIGSKVDLNIHEVVDYRPSTDHPNDTVIGERQKGYIFRSKLLRDAKVVVAYNERR
jgi:molecular chaperone GrpE (heat shock protein)